MGLQASELDKIQRNSQNSEEALYKVINAWTAQCYNVNQFGQPSWRALVNAVGSSAGGDSPLLARKIAADHPGISVPRLHC